jgi:hypothetical protein
MYKLLRIVSLVLFFGGLVAAFFLGLYTMFILPFAGLVGFLVAVVLDDDDIAEACSDDDHVAQLEASMEQRIQDEQEFPLDRED